MVIRAIIRNGQIEPIDPLPQDCREGDEVQVKLHAIGRRERDEKFADKWLKKMRQLGPAKISDEEQAEMEQVWQVADAQAKEIVRRQMELP